MPNHLHLLIEINDLKPKFNFSEIKILNYDIDLDIRNCFVSGSFLDFDNCGLVKRDIVETDSSPSLPIKKPQDIDKNDIETDRSTSLQNQNPSIKSKLKREANSISSFIAILKALTTKRVIEIDENYEGSIWQSNYHDHIVRNKKEFEKIYYYIENNVKKWSLDSLKK